MNIYFSLGLCFAPLFLCFIFFKIFSKINFLTELISCITAMFAVLFISFVQFLLSYSIPKLTAADNTVLSWLLKPLFVNGLIEEGLKLLFLIMIPRKKTEFAHYFMASFLFGIAFGCFESAVYFLQYLQLAKLKGAELIYHLIFARMFSSVFVHAFCAGLLGLFIWSIKEKRADFLSLAIPIVTHGLYDFFVSQPSRIRWFFIPTILVLILESRIRYEKIKPESEYQKTPEPQKGNCDATIETPLKDAPPFERKQ